VFNFKKLDDASDDQTQYGNTDSASNPKIPVSFYTDDSQPSNETSAFAYNQPLSHVLKDHEIQVHTDTGIVVSRKYSQ
jgi:hypothetical protein